MQPHSEGGEDQCSGCRRRATASHRLDVCSDPVAVHGEALKCRRKRGGGQKWTPRLCREDCRLCGAVAAAAAVAVVSPQRWETAAVASELRGRRAVSAMTTAAVLLAAALFCTQLQSAPGK